MAKITLTNVENLQNETTVVSTMKANNSLIEIAVENTLSRDGSSPNTMSSDIDMNSHTLNNLADPSSNQQPVTKAYGDAHYGDSLSSANSAAASATTATTKASAASTSASNAATSETNAATSETNAATSETNAAASATEAAGYATDAANSAAVVGARYTFDSSTAMSAPAAGELRFNNATVSSVTALALHAQDAESGNPDISDYVATWKDSSNTVKGYVVLRKVSSPSTFAIFTVSDVTDNTTWLQVDVTYVDDGGSWTDADTLALGFTRAGDAGSMSGPASSVDSQIAVFNGTSGSAVKAATGSGVVKISSGVLSASATLAVADGGTGGGDAATARTNLGVAIGSDVQAYDVDTLKADTADVLTAGYAATPYNAGTQSSGTFTPDEANGNMQYATNGGAHTLAPPTNNCTIVVQYTNSASAGAITTSGFTKVTGSSFTTTSGDDFFAFITKLNGFSHLHVQALQ